MQITDDFLDRCCENGHVIRNKPGHCTVLSNGVEACACGHKFIEYTFRVLYERDEVYEDGTICHLYRRLHPIQCHACGRMITGFSLTCVPNEQAMDNFIEAKAKGLMPNGLMEN